MQPASRPEAADEMEETFFALRRVGAAIRGRFQRALSEHGLTVPQWLLLKALRRRGRLSVRELAEHLQVTPANVTGILDRLERDGLVARSRSADDRRVVFVRLTEQGHEKVAEMLGLGARVLAGMFEGWTPADLAAFRGMLGRIRVGPEDEQEL